MWTLEKVAERIIGLSERREMKCRNAMILTDTLPGSQLRALWGRQNLFFLIDS